MSIIKTSDGEIKFRVYEGSILNNLPEIIKKKYKVLDVESILLIKTFSSYFDPKFTNFLNSIYFDTLDTVIYHPDGRIKFVKESKSFENFQKGFKSTSNGSIILYERNTATEEINFNSYPEEINGIQMVFDKGEISKYANISASNFSSAVSNPIFNAIFNGNKIWLEEFVANYMHRMQRDFPGIGISLTPVVSELERIITINPCNENFILDGSMGFLNTEYSRLLCTYNSFKLNKYNKKKNFEDHVKSK